jgi:hypothetical protein
MIKLDTKGKPKRYEKDFQREVEQLLSYVMPKGKYGWWIHISPEKGDKKNKGLPDIIGWYYKHIKCEMDDCEVFQPFYIELKVGHNKPSLYQLQKMNELNICGAKGCVAYNIEDVKSFLKKELYINID